MSISIENESKKLESFYLNIPRIIDLPNEKPKISEYDFSFLTKLLSTSYDFYKSIEQARTDLSPQKVTLPMKLPEVNDIDDLLAFIYKYYDFIDKEVNVVLFTYSLDDNWNLPVSQYILTHTLIDPTFLYKDHTEKHHFKFSKGNEANKESLIGNVNPEYYGKQQTLMNDRGKIQANPKIIYWGYNFELFLLTKEHLYTEGREYADFAEIVAKTFSKDNSLVPKGMLHRNPEDNYRRYIPSNNMLSNYHRRYKEYISKYCNYSLNSV